MRAIIAAAGVVLAAALTFPAATSAASTATAVPASSSPRAEHPLFDVSCTSLKYCVAVGYDERADGGDGGPIAETWNGRTWFGQGAEASGWHLRRRLVRRRLHVAEELRRGRRRLP